MSSPPVDPEQVYRVWRMKVDNPGWSLREIERQTGIPKTTVGRYVQMGYEAESWGTVLDRAAMRGSMTELMDASIGWLFSQRMEKHDLEDKLSVLREMRGWLALKAQLNGLNLPARVEVSTPDVNTAREKFSADPTLVAVRELQRQNEWDENEVRAGRPGMVKPREEWTG